MSSGSTMHRCRLTSTLGSPGAGSITAVRSRTAVTHTCLPSTTAGKSGRITASFSVVTRSSGIRHSDCFSDMTQMVSHLSRSAFGFWRKSARGVGTPRRRRPSPAARFTTAPAGVLVTEPEGPQQGKQQDREWDQMCGEYPEEVPAVPSEHAPELEEQ